MLGFLFPFHRQSASNFGNAAPIEHRRGIHLQKSKHLRPQNPNTNQNYAGENLIRAMFIKQNLTIRIRGPSEAPEIMGDQIILLCVSVAIVFIARLAGTSLMFS